MVEVYPEGRHLPFTAGADITAGQVVELSGDGTVVPAGDGSTKVVGVALTNAKAGEMVTVVTEGVVEVIAAGAINAGDKVQSAAGGKVAKWTASAAGDSAKIIGTALTSALADGDKVKVLMK